MASEPPNRPTGGTGILLILILLVVVGALVFWGWSRHSPSAPNPTATALPKTVPNAAPPPSK
ncbi:MAG: hypothetical protein JWP15_1414 [Alphaproteobacteria bacterium]|nr:hypothetical protein [Alphaproteobacteria bacterium]